MRQTKFCTAGSLSRLASVVLFQAEEQELEYFTKYRAFIIIIIKVQLSKICLMQLMWPNHDIHEDTMETICSLNIK